MMLIGMMTIGTTTGFAKTIVNNNSNIRKEVRKEVRHEIDKRHTVRHDKAMHIIPSRRMERTITVVEYRALNERPKRCTVCKDHLHKGERHTHIVKVMK